LIIKEHAKGLSLREIAKALEAKGLKTARGGQWRAGTIKTILDSPQTELLTRKEARKELTAQDKKPALTLNPDRVEASEFASRKARRIIENYLIELKDYEQSGEQPLDSKARREFRKYLFDDDKALLEMIDLEIQDKDLDDNLTRWELRRLYLEGLQRQLNGPSKH
jgi:hypothetical protein